MYSKQSERKTNHSGVFYHESEDQSDLRGTFMCLKNYMVTLIQTQWDIVFLEQYLKEAMIPRSLRWNVFPEKYNSDNELKDWFQYFNDAGTKFLGYLIGKKNKKLKWLETEINILK